MTTDNTLRLFDDQHYTAHDFEACRLVYRPVSGDNAVLSAQQGDVQHLMALNLTSSHFVDGATGFKHLKENARNVCNAVFNALGFATDKKDRLLKSLAQQQKKQKKKKVSRRKALAVVPDEAATGDDAEEAAADANGEEAEAMDVEAAAAETNQRLSGALDLTVFLETLITEEDAQVVGYRFWFFDVARDQHGVDLLTKGMRESIREATQMRRKINEKLEQLERAVGGTQAKRAAQQKTTLEVNEKYQYTEAETEELFMSMVDEYFIRDGLLQQSANRAAERDGQGRKPFTDPRSFLKHNQQQGALREQFLAHRCFPKEQAMFYHAEADHVSLEQRFLPRYFAPYSEKMAEALGRSAHREAEHKESANRLERMMKKTLDAKTFHHFPFPRITYRVAPTYLCHEVMSEMVLPHPIGSYLYTVRHQQETLQRIKALQAHQEEDAEEDPDAVIFGDKQKQLDDELDARALKMPLGLHDTEFDVTAATFHQHHALLTDDMKRYLNGTPIPPNVRDAFIACIRNGVERELQNSLKTVRETKTDLLVQRTAGAAGAAVPTKTRAAAAPFRMTTMAGRVENRLKHHTLDKFVSRRAGSDSETVSKERAKMLSSASLAQYREVLRKWRPTHATIEEVKAYASSLKYDETFMERDIYLVLDSLNDEAYKRIDQKYFDPKTGTVREGQLPAYQRDRRDFMEAALVEYWNEFLTSDKVSFSNRGIRDDLVQSGGGGGTGGSRIGRRMPLAHFDIQSRPFHYYMTELYAYFADQGALSNHYKTMTGLWHAKYHHCRSYHPGCKDPKLSLGMSGDGMGGKSHKLNIVKESCPSGVCDGITHWTNQAFNVDQNLNDMLIINEEMSNKLVGSTDHKGGSGQSEAAMDDARNNFKERATSGQTTTLAFYFDELTGDRKVKLSKCQCQCNILWATNNNLSGMDPNVASRFVIISVPKPKNDSIFNRTQDKNKLEAGRDPHKSAQLIEEQREIHRVYFMVEKMIQSGVLGDSIYGVEVDGARVLIDQILDRLSAQYNIPTNDPRKRKHVLEMTRCMCISFAVWFALKSPTLRHLQHDPYTGEFIGFNPRVMLDGIVPLLVCQKDHVIAALTTLSCLWGHEFQEPILENIATRRCKLDQLRQSDFLHRARDSAQSEALETAPLTNYRQTKKAAAPSWALGGQGYDGGQAEQWDINYNYIVMTAKSNEEIFSLLSQTTGELQVSAGDIHKILNDLSKRYILSDGYEMDKDARRLVRSTDKNKFLNRKIVDFGNDAVTNLAAIAVSVAFLKQKLPYALGDSIIQDLGVQECDEPMVPDVRESSDDDEPPTDHLEGSDDDDDDSDPDDLAERRHAKTLLESPSARRARISEKSVIDLHRRLQNALVIAPGDTNESSLIKAIKDVLENSVLEHTGEYGPDDEEAIREDYGDVINHKLPWLNFVTAEHPQSLVTEDIFPDLIARYRKIPGFSREIPLVDKLAVIQLNANPRGQPLIVYNHTTVSPIARACLSVYDQSQAADGAVAEQAYESYMQRRFKIFSETPTFRADKDLDYIYAEAHLRRMACPEPRINGRLINYPAHMYMTIIDSRDSDSELRGTKRPFYQPYLDVLDRIQTTRTMIAAKIGDITDRSMPMSQLMTANYAQSDVAASVVPHRIVRRRLAQRAQEGEFTRGLLGEIQEEYGTHLQTDLKRRPQPQPLLATGPAKQTRSIVHSDSERAQKRTKFTQ